MALETSAEKPAPVRTISRLIGDYVGRLGAVWIDGQVAEFRPRPGARNHYFVLRDPDVDMSISVVADASLLGALAVPLQPGARVIVNARPEYWTGRGSLQFRAREIREVGLGELLAQIERLKAVLAAEGLFAPERKRPLPFLPRRIGLICGRASAAMTDVLVNVEDRWPGQAFDVREVAVQGVQAVAAITEALAALDAVPDVDVIVLARGGGSVEDLLPFSNEALIRAVAACRTPVVSAIGHEQDAPLVDFVADLRASTPTDAAKRIVPSMREEAQRIATLRTRMQSHVQHLLEREVRSVADHRRRAANTLTHRIDRALTDVEHLRARVRALSPQATLDRGYAIVTTGEGSIVRDADEVVIGQTVQVRVAQGSFAAVRAEQGSPNGA